MGAPRAQAPVPIEAEPRHRTELENGLVRLFDVTIPPGDATLLHTHSHDVVCITLSNASIWTETELGERRESTATAGRVRSNAGYSRTPRAHRVGNRGRAPYRMISLEILTPPGSAGKPLVAGDPQGFTEVLEDENVVVYRIELEPGEGTGRHRYLRPAVFVRLPDGAFEWIEEGTDRELRNPPDARSGASVLAIVVK